METPPDVQPFKYRAFISYSHADEQWAKWLHRALETYRVPKRLVGKATPYGPVPERLTPIFRDRDELATATSLGETLTAALEQSACQLVICSTKAAQSRWVNEEIKTFKRLGKAHRIFAVIVDGEPHASANPATAHEECFPPALIRRMGADGELTDEPTEPIAADLRPQKDSKLDVKLKLVAGMLGVGLDELKQREAHRRHRQAMFLTAASIAGMAITTTLAGAAWIARNEAERQRARAEEEAETARQTTQFMLDLFKVSDPSEALGNTITAREILDKGAERIDRELADRPGIQATLMDTMGTVYTSLGLYDAAMPLVRKAYERRLQLRGPAHEQTAESLKHLGELLTLRAEYAEAGQRLSESLEVRRTLFGNESKPVADTLLAYADLLQVTGEHAKAESSIREALQIQRKLYGRKANEEVARSLETLGLNYYERGLYDDAIKNLREASAMQKDLHEGRAHPAYAQAIDNLAAVLMDTGQFAEAEPLVRLALEMKRKLYGEEHPETSASLNNLAYILESQRRFDEAEAAYQDSLSINRKLLGKNHPSVAVTLLNIAFLDFARGDMRSAIRIARESLDMTRTVLGPEHPDTGARASSLGYILTEAGEYAEAEKLLDEAIAIRRKALGETHPNVGTSLALKALLKLLTKHPEQAYELASEARKITTEGLPSGSWQIALSLDVEGGALMRMGRYAEAEPLMLASQQDLSKAPLPYLADKSRLRLIELYHRWGKDDEVRRLRAAM
jgi:tetratricopeptide (TPR) repeat protein